MDVVACTSAALIERATALDVAVGFELLEVRAHGARIESGHRGERVLTGIAVAVRVGAVSQRDEDGFRAGLRNSLLEGPR